MVGYYWRGAIASSYAITWRTDAPCHNPNIDLWQNPQLAKHDLDQACQVCKKTSVKAGGLGMLLCDKCNEGWHMSCLEPAVKKIPKGDWFCPRCAPRPDTDLVT
jgi:ribosomal protein L37AE/L43A